MRTDKLTLGFAYLRLSNEEAQGGESSSITNQRMIVQNYCKQNGITLVREFVDDGYSGGCLLYTSHDTCGYGACHRLQPSSAAVSAVVVGTSSVSFVSA